MTEVTLSRETVYQGRILNVDVHQVELPNGSRCQREIVVFPNVVCAVVLTVDGRVALVRQFRKPTEQVLLEVPAGKIDPGEDREQAVRRELEEEIGLESGRFEVLLEFYAAPGFCTEMLTCYLVRDAVLGQARPEADELLETELLDFEEAVRLTQTGGIRDAKSIVSLLSAARRVG